MKPPLTLLLAAWIGLTGSLAAAPAQLAAAQPGSALIVSPAGPYTTIEAALADAAQGGVIQVHGGVYPALVVEKSVRLEGVAVDGRRPVIDGGGQGTVVTLQAPGVVFAGFEVRGSGVDPDHDHAGILLAAPDITVEDNHLHDVLFGIYAARADRAVLRGNDITSKAEFEVGRKGDGIRLWYSQDVLAEANRVHETRDVVTWYSENVILRDNLIEGGRYGVHLMYCNGAQIEQNRILDNSVGVYAMYSNGVTLRGNDLRGQRGPSGYALGFKDTDFVTVSDNVIVDNRAGMFLDGTPFSPAGEARFAGNIVAFNDVGVILLAAVRGSTFSGNTLWENVEQVAVQGGGAAGDNLWQGNYWSDYTGFDTDGDGQGDTPYAAERFFESLTDREPMLRALLYSPAAQAIEFAAASFPIVRPQPKLVDEAPRMAPALIPGPALAAPRPAAPLGLAGLGLLLAGLGCSAPAFLRRGRRPTAGSGRAPAAAMSAGALDAVQVEAVSKRYGRLTALDNVSFEAGAGEAVALWGTNGAGKTTLFRVMLGLVEFQGRVSIRGCDVRWAGKAARCHIGYVPQEAAFYDMSVRDTLDYFARLKKAGLDRIPMLLEQLGLGAHAGKSVSALSGGLRQRLTLATALLADPPILLLDEPTANLDAQARRDYIDILAALRQERKTIIFASHRLEEVEALADRVLVMEAGRVVEALCLAEARLRLAPQAELTLRVTDPERALACLGRAGLNARLDGRGAVVVRVVPGQKMRTLTLLIDQGVDVLDFEIERGRLWS